MKKVLSIVLILAVVLTSVFAADIKGNAKFGFDYDIDEKTYGFSNGGKIAAVQIDFKSDTKFSGESNKAGEGAIYAGVKASLNVYAEIDTKTVDAIFDNGNTTYQGGEVKAAIAIKDLPGLKVTAKLEEAYITNDVWKLNLLGSKAASNFATSAVDELEEANGVMQYVNATSPDCGANPGFVFTMKGYEASLGLTGNSTGVLFNALIATPEYNINGIIAKVALVAGTKAADNSFNFGASVKAGYKDDKIEATVATDMLLVKPKATDLTFDIDVAAKFVGYGVTVDAYYAKDATAAKKVDGSAYEYANKNLLSAKASYAVKFNEDFTGKVAFKGLDLVNNQDLSASLSGTYKTITGTVSGGYIIGKETFTVGADVTYKDDLFTATAGLNAAKNYLTIGASASSEKLVAGAKLEAGYASGNLLADKPVAGKIFASATIEF